MNKCKCEWCRNVPNRSGNGYCRRHYDQIRKYGYVLDTRVRTNPNRIVVDGDVARLVITDLNDQYVATAIIDSEDVDRVSEHRWTINDNGYVRTFQGTKPLYLHRFICNYSGKETVDHINRDKLDNRKENLRVVSQSVNNLNRSVKGYRRVNRPGLKKQYLVKMYLRNGFRYCKYFETEEEAKEVSAKLRQQHYDGRVVV